MQSATGSRSGPSQGPDSAVLQQQAGSLAGTAAERVAGVVLGCGGIGAPSSALRLYDRGEGMVLTSRPADLEALHLSAVSGGGGEALYLQGTVAGAAATRFRRQSGGDALRLVMAKNMGPWLRAFSTSRWKVEGEPGEVRRQVAPLGGGAVFCGGNAAPAAATKRATGTACGIPGRGGAGGPESGAQAAAQEEPPASVWSLCQHLVRAAALRR